MESSGRLVILLVAGVIVAFAAIAIRNRMSSEPDTTQGNRVMIARTDLSPGTFIQSGQDLEWVEPTGELPNKDELLYEGKVSIQEFDGAVVRRQLRKGEFIPQTALTKSSEGGFMAAVLEPGMRAVSIAVNATSGNAGFISPGDRVDLIVTHHIKGLQSRDSSGGKEAVVSETFVRDVRVLAVDQMLDNPENKAILAKTVTVEVAPRQAEQISVASEMGKISVALRSLAGTAPRSPKQAMPAAGEAGVTDLYGNTMPDASSQYTRDSDVSQLLDRKDVIPRMRVIRGDQIESIEFY